MEQNQTPRFANLQYDVRQKLDISWAEYALLEMVYHLSYKTGYCYKTAGSIAYDMGLTKQGINKMILRLGEKGLLERLSDNAIRVTEKYDSMQHLSGNKVSSRKQSFHLGGNKVTKVETKLTDRKQSSPKNNSKNNKDNINTTNVVLAKTPSNDINECFSYWQEKLGYAVQSRTKANRFACSNLLKRHSLEGVRRLIDGVAIAQSDQYAPRIADFCDLQTKFNQLMQWGKTRQQSKGQTYKI